METRPAWLDPAAFPFRTRLVDVGAGEQLSVVDEGEGPVVLFSHGTPTWSYEWRAAIQALRGRYRCIAPDHLGFGLSPRPHGADYSPEAHARRWAALVEALALPRYHLVVHDYGGPFALDEALRHPERVASLTAFNTFAWSFADGPRTRLQAWLAGSRLFRWAYGTLNLSFRIARSAWGDRTTLTADTFAPYLAVFPDADSRRRVLWALARGLGASAAFCQSLWDRRGALLNVPAQIIWGLRDSAFGPSALARLHEALPRAIVHTLPRAGHWPHEEAPAETSALIGGFLDAR